MPDSASFHEEFAAVAWTEEFDALYDEAFAKYGPMCLWNARPSRTARGLAHVATRLRTSGNMNAWRHATRIRQALRVAAG